MRVVFHLSQSCEVENKVDSRSVEEFIPFFLSLKDPREGHLRTVFLVQSYIQNRLKYDFEKLFSHHFIG